MTKSSAVSNLFAKIVKEKRIALGLTQNQFAKRIGLSQATISAWELGTKTPLFTDKIIKQIENMNTDKETSLVPSHTKEDSFDDRPLGAIIGLLAALPQEELSKVKITFLKFLIAKEDNLGITFTEEQIKSMLANFDFLQEK